MKTPAKKVWRALLSWPRPYGGKSQVACHFCDTLHKGVALKEGTSARCSRCNAIMQQNRPASLVRATAFSITGLFLMIIVHTFPFLTMDAASLRRELTLMGSAHALIDEGAPILGLSVILFAAMTPILLTGGILYVCLPLMFGKAAPGSVLTAKWIYRTEPWNMVEVFILAVLVSLLKLAKVADVSFELGFWAFFGVMLCTAAAVAGIDREELWDRLEVAQK